jgi:thiamine biosynthesis lipoprotein
MTRRAFESMGCEVIVEGADASAFDAIRHLFGERDATFSRFRPESELVRVNAAAGPVVRVSRGFSDAITTALWAAHATCGLVDPTVGAAIEAAGYDVDFPDLVPDPRPLEPTRPADWRTMRVVDRLLYRPTGTVLDLNGVVKAMAIDDAAALLRGPGYVSAGGDIAARAPVTVALPAGGAITLQSGGIATSGIVTRRWLRGGNLQHHLIDPAIGRPSESPWTYVSAVGRDCLHADIAAKAGYLLGENGPGWLDRRAVAARFVSDEGITENHCWAHSLERERAWA